MMRNFRSQRCTRGNFNCSILNVIRSRQIHLRRNNYTMSICCRSQRIITLTVGGTMYINFDQFNGPYTLTRGMYNLRTIIPRIIISGCVLRQRRARRSTTCLVIPCNGGITIEIGCPGGVAFN